jgi:hypothetical protein
MTATFRVKNFERFQHYKDRNPSWIKVYNEVLENYEFARLPDALKGQLISIWLLASRMDNKIPYDPDWVANKINATEPVDLTLLMDSGFIELASGDEPSVRASWPSRYIAKETRQAVLERDGHKCVRCSATERLEIDHVIPISQGGTGEVDNLQVLCVSCNRKKRAEQVRSNTQNTCPGSATQMRSLEKRERREEEEREKEGAQAPYAFEGKVIKLTRKDFDQWLECFPKLDLRAELASRDAWLDSEPQAQKRWFVSTSAYLAKRNREAKPPEPALKAPQRVTGDQLDRQRWSSYLVECGKITEAAEVMRDDARWNAERETALAELAALSRPFQPRASHA